MINKHIFRKILLCLTLFVSIPLLANEGLKKRPKWVEQLSHSDKAGYKYFVGVSSQASNLEEGLKEAWINSLVTAAQTQFPFLTQIQETVEESNTDVKYKLEYKSFLHTVRWKGLEEVQNEGSPYQGIEDGKSKGSFVIYRLVRWSIADIEKERARLLETGKDSSTQNIYSNYIGNKEKLSGGLRVITKPSGATIVLDGEFVGKSDASFKSISSGTHKIAFILDGYSPLEKEVTIVPATQNEIIATLSRIKGKIAISSEPAGATVYVNNYPIDGKTPIEVEKEYGEYEFRLELPGYFSEIKRVSFGYKSQEISFSLRPKAGKLSIISSPKEAKVYIDDKYVGMTNLLSTSIEGGTHSIRVEKKGFSSEIKEININSERGQSVIFHLSDDEGDEDASAEYSSQIHSYRRQTAIFCGIGALSWVIAAGFQTEADSYYKRYEEANTPKKAEEYREKTQLNDSLAIVSSVFGLGAFLYAGFIHVNIIPQLRQRLRDESESTFSFKYEGHLLSLTWERSL